MCGILGYVEKNHKKLKPDFSDLFQDALKLINHRGPDAFGTKFFWDENIAFGHTRLAIQDLSDAGVQPMQSKDGRYHIIFNGEIYNFKLLKKNLEKRGYTFFSDTDTEVLIYLFAEYREDCFQKLDGIFAIAIYDSEEKELILARDGMGIKPLYYFKDSNKIIFSSEVKSITKLLNKSDLSIDHENINRYLTFLWCPGEGTPFKEIKKINPGEVVKIKNASFIGTQDFYKLPFQKGISKSKNNYKKVIKDLDECLRESIHSQMISDAPVGAFLSGGLDSTSIVNYAKEIDPHITCFTIDTLNSHNDPENDLPYAKKAAKHLKVPLEIVKVDSNSLVRNLEKMIWHLDEPLADPAPLNVLYISELAKQHNIKVLLSGAGGDDIFTGYRRHQAVILDSKLQKLPKSMLSGLEKSSQILDKRIRFFRRLTKLLNGISMSGEERIINYFRWANQSLLNTLFTASFKAEIEYSRAEEPMLNFLNTTSVKSSNLDKILALDQRFFTTDHNLIYTDKMSMAAGVEVRVPLLSKKLVEFASTIPDNIKQKGFEGKWIFKKTMESYLPKDIIYRTKNGFGAPIREWLKNELKDYVGDLLSNESIASRGFFEPKKINELIKNNNDGKIDASYTIFSLICIEIWCRQNIDLYSKANIKHQQISY